MLSIDDEIKLIDLHQTLGCGPMAGANIVSGYMVQLVTEGIPYDSERTLSQSGWR